MTCGTEDMVGLNLKYKIVWIGSKSKPLANVLCTIWGMSFKFITYVPMVNGSSLFVTLDCQINGG